MIRTVQLTRKAAIAAMLSVSLVTISGAQTTNTAGSVKPAVQQAQKLKQQETCPVHGGKINKSMYADVKGKRIYVCCGGCIDIIKKDPDKYIKILADKGEGVETIAVSSTDKKAPVTVDTLKKGTSTVKDSLVKEMNHDHDHQHDGHHSH